VELATDATPFIKEDGMRQGCTLVPIEPLLSLRDAATILNCSPDTVRRLCKLGLLLHCYVGSGRGRIRIRPIDLDEYLRNATPILIQDAAAKRRRHLNF
jgi:hypothetical protein